jgi:hypothetical protein
MLAVHFVDLIHAQEGIYYKKMVKPYNVLPYEVEPHRVEPNIEEAFLNRVLLFAVILYKVELCIRFYCTFFIDSTLVALVAPTFFVTKSL